MTMDRGLFFGPDEGTTFTARGSHMVFKATAQTTGGAFSLMHRELPAAGRRTPAHRHAGPEAFYVLDGAIEFVVGDESRVGGLGFCALVPGGVAHTFGNAGDTPARLLIIHAPAADPYFEDLERIWSSEEPPTTDDEREVMKRHGIEPA